MECVNICDYKVTTSFSDDELQKRILILYSGEVLHFSATSEVGGGSAKLLIIAVNCWYIFSLLYFSESS